MDKNLKVENKDMNEKTQEKKCGFSAFLSKYKKIIIPISAGVVAVAVALGVWGYIKIKNAGTGDIYTMEYEQMLDTFGNTNEDNVAVSAGDTKISDAEWDYYFSLAAKNYAEGMGLSVDTVDWNKAEENGVMPIEKVKSNALREAIADAAAVSYAKEWGITLSEEELKQVDVIINYWKDAYGENVYNELGIKDEQTFRSLIKSNLMREAVIAALSENPEKYLKDVDLTKYLSEDNVTVKMTGAPKYSTEETAKEAKTRIDEIKARLDKGESFDTIWLERYEEMTGAKTDKVQTETISKDGATNQDVKDAAFALKVNEISDVINIDASYVILMRTVGEVEIENYLVNTGDIEINKKLIDESEVK